MTDCSLPTLPKHTPHPSTMKYWVSTIGLLVLCGALWGAVNVAPPLTGLGDVIRSLGYTPQPASSALTNLSNGNGSALTNAAGWAQDGTDSTLVGTASVGAITSTNQATMTGGFVSVANSTNAAQLEVN